MLQVNSSTRLQHNTQISRNTSVYISASLQNRSNHVSWEYPQGLSWDVSTLDANMTENQVKQSAINNDFHHWDNGGLGLGMQACQHCQLPAQVEKRLRSHKAIGLKPSLSLRFLHRQLIVPLLIWIMNLCYGPRPKSDWKPGNKNQTSRLIGQLEG